MHTFDHIISWMTLPQKPPRVQDYFSPKASSRHECDQNVPLQVFRVTINEADHISSSLVESATLVKMLPFDTVVVLHDTILKTLRVQES